MKRLVLASGLALLATWVSAPDATAHAGERVVTADKAVQAPPPPPRRKLDFGDLDHFQSCSAKPRRELSQKEKCQIEKLAEDCTVAADCLVTCISSPDAQEIGGGCDHVCFYPRHPWSSRPKVMDECEP